MHAKHRLIKDGPSVFTEGFATHLAASGVAGFCCSAVSAPGSLSFSLTSPFRDGRLPSNIIRTVDTIKVRMMADTTHQFKGVLHCVALLMKNEGELPSLTSLPITGRCASSPSLRATIRRRSLTLKLTNYSLFPTGPLALYSGATMCFLRLWPQSVLSLLVFEYTRKAAGIAPI